MVGAQGIDEPDEDMGGFGPLVLGSTAGLLHTGDAAEKGCGKNQADRGTLRTVFAMSLLHGVIETSRTNLIDGGTYTCGKVKHLTLEHAQGVRTKITDLRRLEKLLVKISSQCEGGKVPECPIIDALLGPGAEALR